MTHRERVHVALAHEEVDRVPCDLGGGVSSLTQGAYERLTRYLGIVPGGEVGEFKVMKKIDEEILELLDVDFRHVFNIPPEKRELPEGVPEGKFLPDGTVQGRNFFRRNAYMGPEPPFGTHRYRFRIFALDTRVSLDPKMTRRRLLKEMDQHILAQAQLVGLYGRR